MKLAYWMYAGPAHIGVLRVSSSFKNVHAIMHAPLGDDYFNVMRSMLERERDFTPVTASIVDRHVLARGSQEKVVENITRKNKEESPDLIILTPTCTSSILQEDLHNFVEQALPSAIQIPEVSPILDKQETVFSLQKITGVVAEKKPTQNKTNFADTNLFVIQNPNQEINLKQSEILNKQTTDIPAVQKYSSEIPVINNSSQKQPDVILADVNHYRVNELQAADRTLEQIVRYYIEKAKKQNNLNFSKTEKPSVNIIGIFTLGFHNQHDCRELKRLFNDLGIKINEIIPEGGNVNNLKNLPQAWFNFVPYREVGLMTAVYLKSEFNMPYISLTPMGLIDTAACIRSICKIITNHILLQNTNLKSFFDHNYLDSPQQMVNSIENLFNKYIDQQTRFLSQAAWFSRSIDCQNLTGKKAVVFGDATHAAAMTKILAREMGIRVSCSGTYCKHDADWFREQVSGFCDQILITDDHTQVSDTIAKLEPAAIFGTQMERHVGKRLDIPCGVISAPVHIQNFPLGYRPFLGYEGTNQIADLVYNSFNLGMEDHLLQIFGGHDSFVNDLDNISHLSGNVTNSVLQMSELSQKGTKGDTKTLNNISTQQKSEKEKATNVLNLWSPEALAELNKVPGFVRGKVKRNTEKYALENNIILINVEVMYAAKEALST
uniref:Light-independent protochlorophyllide reductase subunit B n=1 Tax=Colemanosphaera angeleri TaxID=1454018 RepID=A0A6C0RXF9_9CHLO|nr:ChlB subunit of protochlorophyllide reductase [Colemanosphaera angeleri]QIA47166.1 ChlB subunit of protochlorophyllide reductase [Colemanosphaera angeleri]